MDEKKHINAEQKRSTIDFSEASSQSSTENAETEIHSINETKLAVLLCGTTDLRNEDIACKVQLVDQLGRRKLKDQKYAVAEQASRSELLWLAPRKYWTYSKEEQSMQDQALKVADMFLASHKDVLIVTQKDFRFRDKDPSKLTYRHETPGHKIYCTRDLSKVVDMVGPSSSEHLLTTAIVQCLVEGRLGVGQSNSETYLSKHSKKQEDRKTDRLPDAQHPRQSKRKLKRMTSKSPETKHNKKEERKVRFDDDDGDELGDHASNSNVKPNYAKEYAKGNRLNKKQIEQSHDDCGEDVTAIDSDDTSAFAAFIDDDSHIYVNSDDSNKIVNEDEFQQVYFSSLDDLLLFASEMHESCAVEHTYTSMLSEAEQQSIHIAAELNEPYCSHFWTAPNYAPLHVMEIFGGYGGVTRIAIKKRLRVGKCFDINVGIDLTRPNEKRKLFQYIDQHKPECIVMGPPCTSFSAWSRFNRINYYDAWFKSYQIGLPLAELCAAVAQLQMRSGRFFLIENPWSSEIWNLPCFQQLLQSCHVAYCEQCCFGLVDMNGEPTLKPTAFVSNSPELVENLEVSCNGRHQYHAPLAGKLHGVAKTKFAQRWPFKLCRVIVESVAKVCFQKSTRFTSTSRAKSYLNTFDSNVLDCHRNVLKLEANPNQLFCEARPVQQVYAGSSTDQPTFCPGCRAHAYRRDPRHNRVREVCKFPDDTSDELTCPACKRSLASHHPLHNKIPGECHWAEAVPRVGSRSITAPQTTETSSSSHRGPQPTNQSKA